MVYLDETTQCDDCKAGRHEVCEERGKSECHGCAPGTFGGSIVHCKCIHSYHHEASQKRHLEHMRNCGYGAMADSLEAWSSKFPQKEQIAFMREFVSFVALPEGTVERWFAEAKVKSWEQMDRATLQKHIDYLKERYPTAVSAMGVRL